MILSASSQSCEMGPDTARGGLRGVVRRFALLVILLPIFLFLCGQALTLAVRHSRLHRAFTARLGAALGRPVEVGSYSVTLWGAPALEANSVSVAEDPRFGNEYFLRAESLTTRLRWNALFRGRIELGTLSLSRPSLNLVRNQDGRWNLQAWLPSPAGVRGSASARSAFRLGRIEVDRGRINFKRGQEKLPFALTDVNGWVELGGDGRWQVNVDATPSRAAVSTQQAGTVHVVGRVGGTSSRLRPAELTLSWNDASLPDALRLARRYDHGLRGIFSAEVEARTTGPDWNFRGRADLSQLHRWDLAPRSDNPAIHLEASALLPPTAGKIEFPSVLLQMPHSAVEGRGEILWNSAAHSHGLRYDTRFHISSGGIGLADGLAWLRAFRSGVTEQLTAEGSIRFDAELSGWPSRIESGSFSTDGAQLEGASLQAPVSLSRSALRIEPRKITLEPLAIGFEPADGLLRITGTASRTSSASAWQPAIQLSGQMNQTQDMLQTAEALGWSAPSGWEIHGAAHIDLRWEPHSGFSLKNPTGTVELDGVTLRAPFLNLPVTQVRGRSELRRDSREVTISNARAFGADWTVKLVRRSGASEWTCALATPRLTTLGLGEWLNGTAATERQGLLERVLPFLRPDNPAAPPAPPDWLRCHGSLSVSRLMAAHLEFERARGDMLLAGKRFEWSNASAEIARGTVHGFLSADAGATRKYRIRARFDHLNLAALTARTSSLAGSFAGVASGEFALSTGVGFAKRDGEPLSCEGRMEILKPEIRGMDLIATLSASNRRTGTSSFTRASGAFSCEAGKVKISSLRLFAAGKILEVAGSVDSSRNLDVRVRAISAEAGEPHPFSRSPEMKTSFHLAGPLPRWIGEPTEKIR